nr:activating signal cointegrator 1 complex subunit 3-like [Cherax quadricarinatus]
MYCLEHPLAQTVAAESAMFRLFREMPEAKAVYIAPLKALVRERVEDWRVKLQDKLGKNVVELTGDVSPDIRSIQAAHVIITTPEKWDGISRSWQTRNYVTKVSLIIIDEIHLLGEDRGPVLEVIVSRTNFISSHTNKGLRVIGLSTALANAKDLANWLGIGQMGLYNFRPSVRPVPLEVHISGFPGKHYCPRMATMNKPTFQGKYHVTYFCIILLLACLRDADIQIYNWVVHSSTYQTEVLYLGLGDVEARYDAQYVFFESQSGAALPVILITTATLAWGVNFPAHLVVIKGTEYYDGKTKRYVDFPITGKMFVYVSLYIT